RDLTESIDSSQEKAEPPSPVDPAGTSEVEQLQDEAKHLRKEVESLEGNLQFQMENNQALSLLSKEQKERLREQEERLQEQEERRLREEERLCEQKERLWEKQKRLGEQVERLRKQEDRLRKQEERLRKEEERLQKQEERLWEKEERLQKQEERLQKQEERFLLSQNHKFDKQLAEPQCDLENLNNKNKSALLLEQQVNELQEKLREVNETVKLLELQDMVLPVVDDHEGHDKFLPAAQNPVDQPAPGAPAPWELAAAEEQGDFHDSVEPAAGKAREGSPRDNPTAQKILQLLPVMQNTQEHPGLATKPCVPFFYQAAENREINIIII
ncbi:hypothetical protein H8958_012483, partial [Nasalis larvatus]